MQHRQKTTTAAASGPQGGPAPPAGGKGRLGMIAAGALLIAFMAIGSRALMPAAGDQLTPQQQQAATAALARIEHDGITVDRVADADLEQAIASMGLPDSMAALKEEFRQHQRKLVWLKLSDWAQPDGDGVSITAGGLTEAVPFLHTKPDLIAIPEAPVAVITGIADGQGGVTVGIGSITTTDPAELNLKVGESHTIQLHTR